jgi:calcyphosin
LEYKEFSDMIFNNNKLLRAHFLVHQNNEGGQSNTKSQKSSQYKEYTSPQKNLASGSVDAAL